MEERSENQEILKLWKGGMNHDNKKKKETLKYDIHSGLLTKKNILTENRTQRRGKGSNNVLCRNINMYALCLETCNQRQLAPLENEPFCGWYVNCTLV